MGVIPERDLGRRGGRRVREGRREGDREMGAWARGGRAGGGGGVRAWQLLLISKTLHFVKGSIVADSQEPATGLMVKEIRQEFQIYLHER